MSDSWYGWLSVAFSKTERTNKLTNEAFDFEYDSPLVINVVSNYEINNNWQLGGRWRYQSGSLYTPINGAVPIYNQDQNEILYYEPINEAFNSQRFSPTHRLDIRLDYKTSWHNRSVNFYFEVLNLYSRKNLEGYKYNEDYTTREGDHHFPDSAVPSFGIKMSY